jgi:hypothetical protein
VTYSWHDIDGRMAEICDECGFDARELVGREDETVRLDAAYADLERLLDHPDADRQPAEGTWSAREYVDHVVEVAEWMFERIRETTGLGPTAPPTDLAGCRRATAEVCAVLTEEQRAAMLRDEYAQDVSMEWLVRHILHDTEHHVLDLRRGYSKLGRTDHPEISFRQ